MSFESEICYFMLGNCSTHKKIGEFINDTNKKFQKNCDKIKSICDDLFQNSTKNESSNIKQKTSQDNYYIFYSVINNTFYLAIVEKDSNFIKNENSIYELFEDIENQGIKKLTDKNGELLLVGEQNLKLCLRRAEKNTKKNQSNEEVSKISMLNNELNVIQNDVNESVKNLIHNVNDFEEMEMKSSKIKDASTQFKRVSINLERKMNWQMLINKYGIIAVGICILIIILILI